MPTQRRFEGPTLAAVLATVQKEIGSNAKITSAKKIRTGGFMGFFQRERYEVLVDTAAGPAPGASPAIDKAASPAPDQPKASSLLELAEAVNKTEKRNDTADKPAANTPAANLPKAPAPAPVAPKASPPAASKRPNISTESDAFAEVLSRVAYQAHLTSEEREDDRAKAEPIAKDQSARATQPLQAPEPKKDPEPRLNAPVVERPAVVDRRPQQQQPQAVRTRITDSPLARLGVPAQYIPATYDDDGMDKSLLLAFKALPEVPKVQPTKGSIVAVVGERSDAEKVAAQLCERWGSDAETAVVVASRQSGSKTDESIIRSTRQAENSRRSWSRRKEPTVVAIDAEPGSKNTGWAERMLTAFEPIATWGVADATRKSEDIAAWADSLGGVDCLAVYGVEHTVSPASVLATGIPVDSVDGHSATPAYWTALVSERLQAISS